MVLPFFAFTTSPGLLALPLGMFSQRGVKPKENPAGAHWIVHVIEAQQQHSGSKDVHRNANDVGGPTMLMGSFRAAAVTMAAHTVAAPPISALMASIPEEGFIEIPPLGYDMTEHHE